MSDEQNAPRPPSQRYGAASMEKIVSLCKRRGFIFPASEIYGGLNGVWDYGPLGVELKRNLKNYWWRVTVHERDDVVGMDGSILMNRAVWKASGHEDTFKDPMVECLVTRRRFRADQIEPQSGVVLHWSGARAEARTKKELATIFFQKIEPILQGQNVHPERFWNEFIKLHESGLTVENALNEMWRRDPGVQEAYRSEIKDLLSSELTLPFSTLLLAGKPPESARKIAKQFYAARGLTNATLLGERSEKVERTTRYNPENGALLSEPRAFSLMFKTYIGPVDLSSTTSVIYVAPATSLTTGDRVKTEGDLKSFSESQFVDMKRTAADEEGLTYLRPETAQSIFVQFKNVLEVSRKKLPFGIAQIGKAFRNEINPRNFTFRSREFEQMELEYFCRAEEGMKWLDYWLEERLKFYENIGIPREKLHAREVPDDERAFYSKGTYDIEYDFPFGRQELEGVAYRTNYDLSQHQKASGKSLEYFDEETKQRFVPHVVEPSAGVDRTVLALFCEAYSEDEAPDEKGKMETRVVLRFHPRMAPIKCGVFPLLRNNAQLVAKAKEIVDLLRPHMNIFYDESGAIGRRYRRQDEIGTPFCVTVDFETLGEKDPALRDTVTLRERDSMKQERVPIRDLRGTLTSRIR